MIIGTVRPEEAKVRDSHAGWHCFHSEEDQHPYGSFRVYWHDGGYIETADDPGVDIETRKGWYWQAQYPGCLPDSDACGPFASSRQARKDADEWAPAFDEDYAEEVD